jgi:hypothetical protein
MTCAMRLISGRNALGGERKNPNDSNERDLQF